MDEVTNQIIDIAIEKTKDERLIQGVKENVMDPMICYTKSRLQPFFLGFVILNFIFLILLIVIVWSLIKSGRDLHFFSGLQKMGT